MSALEHYGAPRVDASWFIRPNGYDASGGIHGVAHTQRVWIHAMAIADVRDFDDWQREAVHHAALWHDIGRTHDHADYYHGAKSAGRVLGLGLHEGLDDEIREAALFSVTHHCGSEEHAMIAVSYYPRSEETWDVFCALKDADGLDRVRLGDLDTGFLRFPESCERVEIAWELLEAAIPEGRAT